MSIVTEMDVFHSAAVQKVLKFSKKIGVVRAHMSRVKGHEKVMFFHESQHILGSLENIWIEADVIADIRHIFECYDYLAVADQLLIVIDITKPAPEDEVGWQP